MELLRLDETFSVEVVGLLLAVRALRERKRLIGRSVLGNIDHESTVHRAALGDGADHVARCAESFRTDRDDGDEVIIAGADNAAVDDCDRMEAEKRGDGRKHLLIVESEIGDIARRLGAEFELVPNFRNVAKLEKSFIGHVKSRLAVGTHGLRRLLETLDERTVGKSHRRTRTGRGEHLGGDISLEAVEHLAASIASTSLACGVHVREAVHFGLVNDSATLETVSRVGDFHRLDVGAGECRAVGAVLRAGSIGERLGSNPNLAALFTHGDDRHDFCKAVSAKIGLRQFREGAKIRTLHVLYIHQTHF